MRFDTARPFRPRPIWILLCLLWAALSAPPATADLPDSVLAQVASRPIDRAEFLRQWSRVGPRMVDREAPADEQKQFFLTQLIEKELLAQAAIDAGYEPTPAEAAQLGAVRLQQMRFAYYQREILAAAGSAGDGEDPEARMERERARYEALVDRLVEPLAVAYVDSNLAFLAEAYAAMPSPVSQGDGFVRVSVGIDFPKIDLADTARVLATSTQGPLTVGRFWWHWAQLNPADRARPETAEDVGWWVERFLVQGPMDAEARAKGYDRLPQVEEIVRREYEALASQWYFKSFVIAEVDTNEARLRARWERDPERYHGTPHYLHRQVWFHTESSADSALTALRGGAAYADILRHRFPNGLDRIGQSRYVDTKLLLVDSPDTELKSRFASAQEGDWLGPREQDGRWWIYQHLGYEDGRRADFEQARFFVLQDEVSEQSETLLRERMKSLYERYPIERNDEALAALVLPEPEENR